MAVTTVADVRARLAEINQVAQSTVSLLWRLTADQKAVGRAAAQAAQSDDEYCARVLALVPANYGEEAEVDHAKLKAACLPLGIDYLALWTALEQSFVQDAKTTAARLLAIVEAALSGQECPKMALPGPLAGFIADLWNFAKSNGPALLQLLLAVLSGQPRPAA